MKVYPTYILRDSASVKGAEIVAESIEQAADFVTEKFTGPVVKGGLLQVGDDEGNWTVISAASLIKVVFTVVEEN